MLYSKHQDIVLRHLRCVFSMDVEHICMCINRKLLQIYNENKVGYALHSEQEFVWTK